MTSPQAEHEPTLSAPVQATETHRASGLAVTAGAVVLNRVSYPRQIQKARRAFDREFIREVLRQCDYNISQTARTIGMARRNLQYLLQRLQINVEKLKKSTK